MDKYQICATVSGASASKSVLQVVVIALVAFSETISFVPYSGDYTMLLYRVAITSAIFIALWCVNSRVLIPRLVEKNRYASYLLSMAAMLIVGETLAVIPYMGFFKILTGAALMFICFIGLSTPMFRRIWHRYRDDLERARNILVDIQVADRRLKIHGDDIYDTLSQVEEECAENPKQAVALLYNLSKDLRSQLYDK